MKTIIPVLFSSLLILKISAQQNTFPTVGNVGIGTTTPGEKLTVNGTLKVERGSTLKGEIKMPDLPLVTEGAGLGNNQSAKQYQFLVIGEDGIIKRGVPRPGPLPSLGCFPVMADGTPIPTISSWEYGLYKIYTKCPEVNVGINNENPRVKLDVGGRIYTTGLSIGSVEPSLAGSKLLHLKSFGNFNSTLVSIENHNQEIFKIENNKVTSVYGNLYLHTTKAKEDPNVSDVFGIWSTTGKLLQLNSNGLLQAREIKVDLATWPDYVFEENYKLMPLKELEAYISQHKHLPEVPSQNTVQEEGINLGEMNKILMQKIEELTLYLIEQQKQLVSQQKEIDLLKTKK